MVSVEAGGLLGSTDYDLYFDAHGIGVPRSTSSPCVF
jgi:hypothetical protein